MARLFLILLLSLSAIAGEELQLEFGTEHTRGVQLIKKAQFGGVVHLVLFFDRTLREVKTRLVSQELFNKIKKQVQEFIDPLGEGGCEAVLTISESTQSQKQEKKKCVSPQVAEVQYASWYQTLLRASQP